MNLSSFSDHAPIGIFDSGIGGLSVLRHIRTKLPSEALYYFADSGFAPDGDKPEHEIMQRTLYAAETLLSHGVKAIVVACNTATAAAITLLRSRYPDLVLVGVEPGLKPAVSLTKTDCVAVFATSSTLASTKYQLLCEQIRQTTHVQLVNQACPGLVNQIELGELESQATNDLLRKYLQPIFTSKADILVLGCTHYPFVESSIREIALSERRETLHIIDTGSAIAKQLKRVLSERSLLNPDSIPVLPQSRIQCITTGEPAKLEFALSHLLKLDPEHYTIQELGCNLPIS